MAECHGNHTATFLIMGRVCTRKCRYCNIDGGEPSPLDPEEPARIAEVVKAIGLKYVVITSVTRDDLPRGGAGHFSAVTKAIRALDPSIGIELLFPDLRGNEEALEELLTPPPDVAGHNLETVESLFPLVRPGGNYRISLRVLERVEALAPGTLSKSGLMVGLGEGLEEIMTALEDLRESGVKILTIGQYLQPSKRHIPVARYYLPEEFRELKERALGMGFSQVEAGPLVRSSYHAERAWAKPAP